MDKKEVLKAIEKQVEQLVLENHPKFSKLMNDIEATLGRTPISVRLMMYEVILSDMMGKVIAGGAVAFGYNLDDLLKGVNARIKKVTISHFKDIKKNGEHNVHANGLGQELRTDSTQP